MGLQLIVKADRKRIEKALGPLMSNYEVFPVAEGLFGISIPEQSISSVGEDVILLTLEQLEYFDLWQGAWKKPRRRWFW
ncbi:hypothetical protein EGT71_20715 [Atlantibacter subterranea]|uniref:Uncharacterized protein n=1 Tax=Atlantibacter subterraneus TaxID=255519 RepID=A0A3R9EZA9_9ENTR|nr:hypothetical protein [Atlantibacter subterranea]MDZ5667080.1 hypothetical protein [Atlantibacter hermannii]MDA3131221.1 hypothetical protein [Atlantibacter subterranea]MDV7023936.1 hypothetical protein [Atlantibacter subterranea]RSB59647.1 hypothetical protein EGK67_19685 [Atlantibacter subterranea]RSE05608.1 hypothetical protein EGT84_12610 [Atlantibacter subterranea]